MRMFALSFLTCHSSLACHAGALREGRPATPKLYAKAGHWQNASHENIHVINHNSFRDLDRDFLICAKPCHIAGDCIESGCGPTCGSNRTAESAGDDETDGRDVEAQ